MIKDHDTGGAIVIEDGERVQLITLYTRVVLHLAENPRISQETLARRMDVTMRTVQRHLTELEEEGYIAVDRTKKPFEYTIDWTKSCPHVPWLRVAVFHPEVKDALQGLAEGAARAYERAIAQGLEPSKSLREIVVREPQTVGAR
jgi:DNA-binding transcriptional regulator LsrR (DeoR family)